MTAINVISIWLAVLVACTSGLVSRNVYNLRTAYADPSYHDAEENIVIERGRPVGSMRLKQVPSLLDSSVDGLEAYTLYVTTNQSCNSNIFGFFFQNQVSDHCHSKRRGHCATT